jgi:serine/threonine protein kinase
MGRWSCRRELRFYRALADVPNVPRVLGTIGDTGFVHSFVPGRPLSRDLPVPDGFFRQLESLFDTVHERNIAYVDTNKPQNILIGPGGRPYLIDFQISWDLHVIGDWWLSRLILRHFQSEDRYHLLKHRRRMRPDEMSPGELDRSRRKSILLRLHRVIFSPWFKLRRRTFKRLRDTGRLLPEGSK